MKRRDFLRDVGFFITSAALIPACGDNSLPTNIDEGEPRGTFAFPQGVASGDPRPDSVVLWTRVVRNADPDADVSLQVLVATDADFTEVLVDEQVVATAASDHAVRVLVNDLPANTALFYRFVAIVVDGGVITSANDSIDGQTHTAPAATADVQVNIAWVSCQDYQSGHFGAYRQLIADDDARAEADRVHFVVHLGDMIYETIDESSQRALSNDFEEFTLTEADGSDRLPSRFPSGGGINKAGARFAQTVDDYRHLYKTFLADPALRAARARWPFVVTWDDHEFTNDSWQSQANYIAGTTADEGSQRRKVAASQAWFEFTPVQLSGSVGVTGVTQDAKDFTATAVANARFTTPNNDNFVDEANNAAAIGAMTIYRSLRWGKHVELVMTDQRSYRSDHAIPEEIPAIINLIQLAFFDERNFLPLPFVQLMDFGKNLPGGAPAVIPGTGNPGIPNPRVNSPSGTMLGKAQKAWWKSTMQGSDATWKLWGNEVPMMRMLVKSVGITLPTNPPVTNPLGFDRILDGDAWDGYGVERAELLTFLRLQNIKNVVVLTGDVHAHFAGVLKDNFDAPANAQTTVATELIVAGISSNSLFSFYEAATRAVDPGLRSFVTVDASAKGGEAFTENLNLLIRKGLLSAATFAGAIANPGVPSVAVALGAANGQADPNINTHIRYADTNAQGYGYIKVTEAECAAQLVTINRPVGGASVLPGVKRVAAFTIPKDNPDGMSQAEITGIKPFPLT